MTLCCFCMTNSLAHVWSSKYMSKMINHSLFHSYIWPICFVYFLLYLSIFNLLYLSGLSNELKSQTKFLFIVTSWGNGLEGKGHLYKWTCLNLRVMQSTNSIILFRNEQLHWSSRAQFSQDSHEGIPLYLLLVSLCLYLQIQPSEAKQTNKPTIRGKITPAFRACAF